jgi:peptidoglycan L-alanyl-D-glutamate endopeptidase CwlK
LEPETRERCEKFLAECQLQMSPVMVVHTLRTFEEQALIYAQGRTRPGAIVTNAKPGWSFHQYGRAFDVAFIVPGSKSVSWKGPWVKIGAIGEAFGLEWGGRWKNPDRPHMQFPGGKTLKELREEYDRISA